ncbi:MAG: superoxide dismutase [Candidatus Micrarchaeota archaeon]|nr:superoxide dismutase [Candidatus Micrarchaeota archaeon]
MSEEYTLPDLPYAYNALEPYIDEATMKLHHGKHHAAYVAGLNAALKKLEEARAKGDFASVQALSKLAAFHGSGHIMHSIFWEIMCPAAKSKAPSSGALFDALVRDFGSLDAFKKQFSEAAKTVEGSGWAVLAYEPSGKRLLVLQAENHQKLTVQGSVPLLVLDVWEHAYYLLYKSDRAKYIENWWNILNWAEIEKRLIAAQRK